MAASVELSVYISSKTSGIGSAVSKKRDHPNCAISKGRDSNDAQGSEPAALCLRIQQVVLEYYCSAIYRGNNSNGTQVIVLVYVQEIMQTTQAIRIQQLDLQYFEIHAQHGTCITFLQKSAEIEK